MQLACCVFVKWISIFWRNFGTDKVDLPSVTGNWNAQINFILSSNYIVILMCNFMSRSQPIFHSYSVVTKFLRRKCSGVRTLWYLYLHCWLQRCIKHRLKSFIPSYICIYITTRRLGCSEVSPFSSCDIRIACHCSKHNNGVYNLELRICSVTLSTERICKMVMSKHSRACVCVCVCVCVCRMTRDKKLGWYSVCLCNWHNAARNVNYVSLSVRRDAVWLTNELMKHHCNVGHSWSPSNELR